MKLTRSNRKEETGFTLTELMVVVVLIGIMTATIIPQMKGTYQDALLRSTSRELVNVFSLAYSRAVSINQFHRVRLDQSTGRYLVEKRVVDKGQENFVPLSDVPGCDGKLDSRIAIEIRKPDEAAPAAPQRGVSPASENDLAAGEAFAFYPDGTADAGEVVLRDRDGFRLLLRINPTTARVHIVELERQ